MGDNGLYVDEAGAWSHWLGRVAHKVARSARRFRGRTVLAGWGRDDRGGLVPSDRRGSRMSGQAPEFRDVIGRRDALCVPKTSTLINPKMKLFHKNTRTQNSSQRQLKSF